MALYYASISSLAWLSLLLNLVNGFVLKPSSLWPRPQITGFVSAVPEDPETSAFPSSFQLDPRSDYAEHLLSEKLGLSTTQRDQLTAYCELIVEWNEKINLVSRKDCSVEVVFGRHVLPCLAPILMDPSQQPKEGDRVVDVGTGGGFPGIPMAICYPRCDFLLVDSVGKKLNAVSDMVSRLGLSNVQTLHSRAEEISNKKRYDWCVGRSVASLPKYCGWIKNLLQPSSGKLLYIIGGNVPEAELAEQDYSIHDLLTSNDNDDDNNSDLISEKRILIFGMKAVKKLSSQKP